MTRTALNSCVSGAALACACWASTAFAQTAPQPAAAPPSGTSPTSPGAQAPLTTSPKVYDGDTQAAGTPKPGHQGAPNGGSIGNSNAITPTFTGNEIVVTAAPGNKSRFVSSSSISQVSSETIQDFAPKSEAEILRTIPGIQTAANAGPGGNANIGVRGIPVSTGGSEYVAQQEDGLPVVLFGDINFGNNDYWLRFDDTVSRVEAVRGGAASTFASQAPGAVINFISNTGEHEGGVVSYSNGLDFREHRFDFNVAHHINDTLRFDVGGYFRDGSGTSPAYVSYNVLSGYQIKANITQDLPDGKGFVRLLFKRLDEQAPTSTTTPAIANISGNEATGYSVLPGFDPRSGSTYSKYDRFFQTLNTAGQVGTAEVDGIHPDVTSLGAQMHYSLDSHVKFDDTFRKSWIDGNFTTKFLNVQPTLSSAANNDGGLIGSVLNGQTVGSIRYADGPLQGQVFNGLYVNNNPNINTVMHDMGSVANNMTFTGKYNVGPGTFNGVAGWFHMSQNIVQTWMVNKQYNQVIGDNAAQLDLFSTTGTQLTAAGQAGFNNNWGTCCSRIVDVQYTDDAPFLQAGYTLDHLNLDASVRFDRVGGTGYAQAGTAGPNSTVTDALGTATIPSLLPQALPRENINYLVSYTSWSFGGAYELSNDTNLFARVSRGGRFNADRRLLAGSVSATGVYSGGNFNSDGSLNAQGEATTVNYLDQQEVGWKQRGSFDPFDQHLVYETETTFFHSSLTENNYDFTRLSNLPPNNNPNISNKYRTYGIEFTGNVAISNFRMLANMTYTDAEITGSATQQLVGDTPGGIPSVQYFIQPSYDPGFYAIGFSIDGQTSSYADDFNSFKIAPSTYVNSFLKIRPIKGLELAINATNIFNTLGFRGGGSVVPINSGLTVFQGTANYGRTVEAALRYSF